MYRIEVSPQPGRKSEPHDPLQRVLNTAAMLQFEGKIDPNALEWEYKQAIRSLNQVDFGRLLQRLGNLSEQEEELVARFNNHRFGHRRVAKLK